MAKKNRFQSCPRALLPLLETPRFTGTGLFFHLKRSPRNLGRLGWLLLLSLIAQPAFPQGSCEILLGRLKGDSVELLAHDGGHQVGYLYYSVTDPEHAHVNLISVNNAHRRKGISKRLFAEMVKRHSQIKLVEAILVGDNMRAARVIERAPMTYEACVEAVRRTPFFRAWSRLGYRSVKLCEFNHRIGTFEVGVSL